MILPPVVVVVLNHASAVNVPGEENLFDEITPSMPFVVTAVVSPAMGPAAPKVKGRQYWPPWPPADASAATGPAGSPSRQKKVGLSALTAVW